MDRRRFLQTFLVTTSITPMLLASKKNHSDCELFMLSESPQKMIPEILMELEKLNIPFGKNYSFLNSHPQKEDLCHIFTRQGWTQASSISQASMVLSFSQLHNPAIPSFTLIQDGRVWDIRTQRLRALWEKMKAQPQTSSLTTMDLKSITKACSQGEFAAFYRNGQLLARIPLTENSSQIICGKRGPISVHLDQGKAWVSKSSCSHQICRLTPPVSLSGERIICAPNGFLLEIQGRKSVDTVIG